MEMILLHSTASHVTQLSTDDFGNEVMTVIRRYDDPIFDDVEQIVISEGTWWHLFDMDEAIRGEKAWSN